MTTKRKVSQATSREGVNFVRTLVERHNSTFHEIELGNDLGNDAYIEFVVSEQATGCCIAAQIKSGASYRTPSGRYRFTSDRDHFEYWASHTLPIFGIIVDPQARRAFWIDITEFLRTRTTALAEGPYYIEAPLNQEFSDSSFDMFRQYCLRYSEQYSREPNLGRALDSFAAREDFERCFDGLRALFAYHRHQFAAWYYMISCISNYRDHVVLPALVARLCHIPGHGDIFWSKHNIIAESVRIRAQAFMRERLDRSDAITLLGAIDDKGIDRGTLGQCVHALLDGMESRLEVLESIAVDAGLGNEVRYSAALLAVYYAQQTSTDNAEELLARVRKSLGADRWDASFDEMSRTLKEFGSIGLY